MSTPVIEGIQPLTGRKAWKALEAHFAAIHDTHLRTLFANDPQRGERMTAEGAGLFLDYSKNRDHRRNPPACSSSSPRNPACAERIEAMFSRRKNQYH